MLENYWKVALRTLKKQPLYATINVVGLALGMACCLLLLLLVRHEWSFDDFHDRGDRIYRTHFQWRAPDGSVEYNSMLPPDVTPQLEREFGGIEKATRFVRAHLDVQVENEFFRTDLAEVDPSFFRIFSFEALVGDPAEALEDPSAMVVTRSVAESMLGAGPGNLREALGRTVSISGGGQERYDFSVGAIVADPPETSSLQFEVLISFENYDPIQIGNNNWGGRTSTYVLLAPNQDAASLEEAFEPFVRTQAATYIENLQSAERLGDASSFGLHLVPLDEVHLTPEIGWPYEAPAHNPVYSYILMGIGSLILLIAGINFVTLSIGRSTDRAREVGVRKTLGASEGQLRGQFWAESLGLTALALVLGVAGALAALPFFNDLVGRELSLWQVGGAELVLGLGGLLLLVGLGAGAYPAFLLAGYRPARVLRAQTGSRGASYFVRGLVVLQYAIAAGLIVSTIVTSQQLDYLLQKDLGFDEDLVMVVHAHQVSREDAPRVLEQFRNELVPRPEVVSVARAGQAFTRGTDVNGWEDASGIPRMAYNFGVGFDYVELMDLEIVEGRDFSREFPADCTRSVLVNEALVREFGIDDPIGHRLHGWLDDIYEEPATIIGVVEDFHFLSLRREVQPAVLNMHPDYYNYMGAILVRVRPGDVQGAIELVENQWSRALPGKPLTYSFLEEDLARQYAAEQRWSRIVRYSAFLAILIACMGLFALATLAVNRRIKEIGIRKVLGATVPDVAMLVTREFALLVAVASLIGLPLAYLAANSWLSDYAYRMDLGPTPFVWAVAVTLGVALLTVSYQALRAGLSDPVDTLAYE